MKKIIIRNTAFINMLISSIEVYKKEALGILLGTKKGNNYYIRYAVNFQSAKRHYNYIDIGKRVENRINHTMKHLSKYRLIGDFHSHPDGPSMLSKTDRKDMRDSMPNMISVVVVVKKRKHNKVWKYNAKKMRLEGSVNGYLIEVLAYEHVKGKITKLSVKAPYHKSLNKIAAQLANQTNYS